MIRRLTELTFILMIVAFAVQFSSDSSSSNQGTSEQRALAQPTVSSPISLGDHVPNFELLDTNGELIKYHSDGERTGSGIFLTLTATGCTDCVERIDTLDRKAFELAKKSGFEVWNFLVYQNQAGAAQFVQTKEPSADIVAADSQAKVSVRLLGGSDSTCWMLIDAKGNLIYRGPADLDKLEAALGHS